MDLVFSSPPRLSITNTKDLSLNKTDSSLCAVVFKVCLLYRFQAAFLYKMHLLFPPRICRVHLNSPPHHHVSNHLKPLLKLNSNRQTMSVTSEFAEEITHNPTSKLNPNWRAVGNLWSALIIL